MDLTQKRCIPCEKGTMPLFRPEAEKLLKEVPLWIFAENGKQISRQWKFKNFKDALAFANKVGDVAESEGHHPDMQVAWGKVRIDLTTHAIGGLSENDFILAAKIDTLE